jgi:hypothetical protein
MDKINFAKTMASFESGMITQFEGRVLSKFGDNQDIDSGVTEMVWNTGGIEILPSGNDITHISSSNAGDTQQVKILGHNLIGDRKQFTVQTVTLDGQNKVALDTPLFRIWRAWNIGSTDFAGIVYIYQDDTVVLGVPQTQSLIHATIPIGTNQTRKCALSVCSDTVFFIERLIATVKGSVKANVDFELQIKEFGGVWRSVMPLSISSNESFNEIIFDTPLYAPEKSDIRVIATSDTNNVKVSAVFNGFYLGIS